MAIWGRQRGASSDLRTAPIPVKENDHLLPLHLPWRRETKQHRGDKWRSSLFLSDILLDSESDFINFLGDVKFKIQKQSTLESPIIKLSIVNIVVFLSGK